MTSFSGLSIGLSLVFGCLLLALVAELYYLLWWKKRITSSQVEDDYNNYAKELVQLFCWKKSASLHASTAANNNNNQGLVKNKDSNSVEPDLELGSSRSLLVKGFGEEGVESELMRLHNLAGPPRFLFTIKEETKEDLESEDGRSRGEKSRKGSRTGSLSDLMLTVDTPLSPLASPPLKSPPLNPFDSYHRNGFNPLFESSTDAELNKLRSSPPPKFKFLRDAEEKLLDRLMLEAEKRVQRNGGSIQNCGVKAANNTPILTEDIQGSFLKFIVGKNGTPLQYLPQCPSCSSQILPLDSC
ncbi:hypothetical protein E1A91_D07G111600v1 [Gossypium mustelinum]|uniref:Uncharacterized protein n=6 Tax=Gossypium TaxID=3633 RepID=A0A5J5QPE3_GOSBA|nr:hypothetical protein ES319_D07G107500v1 [Gossypium barbadense]MBA0704041.1 hypothetical protein [Gossypium laxum]TYG61003.1 hypothetical protein ES288_D07G113400v1 [Gossypium darwinii]TYH62324.1 hypothetical protein ES332_D07G112900v1 [Gossypium tomentosum]TYI73154.1 hypothetical protein E1A91_D07G111600v1 [Gossypium mustelinum]